MDSDLGTNSKITIGHLGGLISIKSHVKNNFRVSIEDDANAGTREIIIEKLTPSSHDSDNWSYGCKENATGEQVPNVKSLVIEKYSMEVESTTGL